MAAIAGEDEDQWTRSRSRGVLDYGRQIVDSGKVADIWSMDGARRGVKMIESWRGKAASQSHCTTSRELRCGAAVVGWQERAVGAKRAPPGLETVR